MKQVGDLNFILLYCYSTEVLVTQMAEFFFSNWFASLNEKRKKELNEKKNSARLVGCDVGIHAHVDVLGCYLAYTVMRSSWLTLLHHCCHVSTVRHAVVGDHRHDNGAVKIAFAIDGRVLKGVGASNRGASTGGNRLLLGHWFSFVCRDCENWCKNVEFLILWPFPLSLLVLNCAG
jgi:hypothetical protein